MESESGEEVIDTQIEIGMFKNAEYPSDQKIFIELPPDPQVAYKQGSIPLSYKITTEEVTEIFPQPYANIGVQALQNLQPSAVSNILQKIFALVNTDESNNLLPLFVMLQTENPKREEENTINYLRTLLVKYQDDLNQRANIIDELRKKFPFQEEDLIVRLPSSLFTDPSDSQQPPVIARIRKSLLDSRDLIFLQAVVYTVIGHYILYNALTDQEGFSIMVENNDITIQYKDSSDDNSNVRIFSISLRQLGFLS